MVAKNANEAVLVSTLGCDRVCYWWESEVKTLGAVFDRNLASVAVKCFQI
jgi:hypothetical protein